MVIEDAWKDSTGLGSNLDNLQVSLRKCSVGLGQWSSSTWSDREKLIAKKTAQLKSLQDCEGIDNVDDIKMLKREVGILLAQEDLRWKQRAKLNWYKAGDRNTRFFHSYASQRRRKNRILEVRDPNDILRFGPASISIAFGQHFESIFRLLILLLS